MKKNILSFLLAFFCLGVHAQDTLVVSNDDENFVISSLLITEPGGKLYSRFGHACIRMQCPEHNLDYCFSYESEEVSSRVLSFLAGHLKMGLFAIPTQDYLGNYKKEQRGVKEYTLDLPIETKRNLWRVLDDHVMEGINLPYDYIQRGCAHSTLHFLNEGLDTLSLQYGPWPEKFELTRRELAGLQMKGSPWNWCFLNLICNGEIDRKCNNYQKIIMPYDLLEVLSNATVDGHPLLKSDVKTLLPDGPGLHRVWCTPLLISIIIWILSIFCLIKHWHWMDYVLLVIQTLLGVVTIYLVCFSSLCCTEWSWLIIPFNILPLIGWKWRKHWALPYAIILFIWSILMTVWPHSLTDWPYIVLTITLSINYISIYLHKKSILQ